MGNWRANLSIRCRGDWNIHSDLQCGSYTVLGENIKIAEGVQIGRHCIIGSNCVIGKEVTIGDYVRLGDNTILGDRVFMDSYTLTSGECTVGKGSQIRYQSIIARNVLIGEDVFFCAGVKTAYLNHMGNASVKPMRIRDKVFVGDNSTILSSLDIAEGAVIGAHALVTKDILKGDSIYIGCPAIYLREMRPEEIQLRDERIGEIWYRTS